jgi:hypothetical protein
MEKTDKVGEPGNVSPTDSSGSGREGTGGGGELFAEGAFARTGGDGLVLLVDAVVVIRRIPGVVLSRGHKLVCIQVVVPVLWFGNIWELGRFVVRSRGKLASGRIGLVFKVIIPVFWMGDGMSWRGGGAGFGPLL